MEFAFYHCLVDDDPVVAAPALEAFGRASASWSRLEHHVDALIVQINKPAFSADLFEKHPVSFSKKVDLLKKWFNRYPPLGEYKTDMRYLTSRLKTLSGNKNSTSLTRNLLVHSIPAAYDPETQTITFHNMQFVGENILSRHASVTLTQIEHFSGAAQLCNNFLGTITRELFTPDGVEKLGTLE